MSEALGGHPDTWGSEAWKVALWGVKSCWPSTQPLPES